MAQFLQALVSGLGTAGVYALVGLGFSFIYATTKVVNFAQGDWTMICGMTVSSVAAGSLGIAAAVVIAPVMGAAVGAIGYFVFVRFLRSADALTRTLSLLGMGFALIGIADLQWGTDPRGLPSISTLTPIRWGSMVITWATIISVATAAVLVVFISFYLATTRTGRTMVATSLNPEAAALCGINVKTVVLRSFVFSGVLAGIAGFLIAPITGVNFQSGLTLTIMGFAASAVGGLQRPVGAVIGAVVLGVVQQMVAAYAGGNSSYLVTLAVALVVLMTWAMRNEPRQFRPEEEAAETDSGVIAERVNV